MRVGTCIVRKYVCVRVRARARARVCVCVCVCVVVVGPITSIVYATSQALFTRFGGHLPPQEYRVSVNQQMHDLSDGVPTEIPTPSPQQLEMAQIYLQWCKQHKNILYLQKLVRHRHCCPRRSSFLFHSDGVALFTTCAYAHATCRRNIIADKPAGTVGQM
jgi:hypothetical protein